MSIKTSVYKDLFLTSAYVLKLVMLHAGWKRHILETGYMQDVSVLSTSLQMIQSRRENNSLLCNSYKNNYLQDPPPLPDNSCLFKNRVGGKTETTR